jgi:DNA-binding transcriptional ArsR family regulator
MPRDMPKILSALGSPIRREILTLIWDRELAAGEIASAFELRAPTISEHLAVLRDAGVVTMRREGTFRRYRARQDVLRGLHDAVFADGERWTAADDLPERHEARTRTAATVVVVDIDVDTDPATTFGAFTDPAVYSRWLGVPVTIEDGRFAADMEFGTKVRGAYDVVAPPTLIAMRWDFDDDNVPIPGGEHVGYLRLSPTESGGTHVEVHQLVDNARQAEFMAVAWSMVLGRLKLGVVAACDPRAASARRPLRGKRRASA